MPGKDTNVDNSSDSGYDGTEKKNKDSEITNKSDTEKKEPIIYDPMHWETELYNNVKARVDRLPYNINDPRRSSAVDAIEIEEAQKLQKKYESAYDTSDNILTNIFSPKYHKTLTPLFTEYPTKETKTNSYLEAAGNGFSSGFSAGLWSEASKGISTEGAGESNLNPSNNKSSNGTVVIGESMAKRVIPYAKQIGADIYTGCKYYDKVKNIFGEKTANMIGGVDNALWIIDKMVNKYKIVDIGIDATRAKNSPYYLMESVLTYLYKHKELVEDFFKGT